LEIGMNRPALALLSFAAFPALLLAQSDILPGSSGPAPCPPGGAATTLFRSVLSPSNVTPPVAGLNASAPVTIGIHQAAGQGRYAVDFLVDYNFGGPVTIVGLQIRSGVAGQSGAIVVDSGISAAAPVQSQTGSGTLQMQAAGLVSASISATLGQIASAPGQYYVEIDTAANPSGALRGQLAAAQQSVAMGLMNPLNEVPPVIGTAAATGTVVATITRGTSGAISSAELILDVNYQFPSADTLTSLQVQAGAAGANGPAVVTVSLGNLAANGSGNVRERLQLDVTQPAVYAFLQALFLDPSGYYLNLVTGANPAGAMRAQLALASRSNFQVGLCQGQLPPGDLADLAIAIDVLRSATGELEAGMVTFDANYQVQPGASLVYLGIPPDMVHTSLSTAAPLVSASGAGNIYQLVTVSSATGLQQLANALLGLQEKMELLTADGLTMQGVVPYYPIGQSHLQVNTIRSAADDPTALPAAPGGLITLFGSFPAGLPNFSAVDVTGLYNQAWPTSLNGTWVTIGDRNIPIGYHSSSQINAQIPSDLPPGSYDVQYWVSKNVLPSTILELDQPDYRSDPVILTVSPQAPAIFVSASGPVITHAATGALVSASQPAAAGETILVYATGIAFGPAASVSASIGGMSTAASLAVPAYGIQGIEILAVTVPSHVSGMQTLTLQAGGTSSNQVQLIVQ
jgi:uncharacterized protein (TIGR03437 family)